MSVSAIGSSFSYVPPERIRNAAETSQTTNQTNSSETGESREASGPPQDAPGDRLSPQTATAAISAQESRSSEPSSSSREASRSYSKAH